MGTRHLTMVFVDGEYKVAQYGQWDGYPSGQGADILDFLKKTDLEMFENKCRKTRFLTKEEIEIIDTELEKDGTLLERKWKQLSRDMGSKVLDFIYDNSDGVELINKMDFAADSLFCEWAYVIDFDKNQLEVYKGFNKQPLDENDRFYFLPLDKTEIIRQEKNHEGDVYHQIRLVKTFNLDDLPTKEEFVKSLEK